MDTLSNNQSVFLNKVKVNNSLYANILTQGGNVNAVNCLFGNSNNYSAYISIGGKYNLNIALLPTTGVVLEIHHP